MLGFRLLTAVEWSTAKLIDPSVLTAGTNNGGEYTDVNGRKYVEKHGVVG